MAYPWVEDGVEQIGGEVAEREHEGDGGEQPTSRGMSLLVAAKWIRLPMPGYLNRVSTTTRPPTSQPICAPMTVTVGSSALRSTWRQMTVRAAGP